jgi:hypothetical protein
MIQDVVEVAVEVLAPPIGPGRQAKLDPDTVAVQFGGGVGAFRDGLNESGWLADEVLAAGTVRQGKPPSVLTAATGLVLLQMVRRRTKSLPREFVLAATADRVVAFAMSAEGTETTTSVIKIKRGELGSWPRGLVRVIDRTEGLLAKGATLELAGTERFPIMWVGDDSSDELIALLGGWRVAPASSEPRRLLGGASRQGEAARARRGRHGGVSVALPARSHGFQSSRRSVAENRRTLDVRATPGVWPAPYRYERL